MNSAAAENLDLSSPPVELRRGQADIWQRYRAAGPGDASEECLVKQYLPLVKTVVGRLAMTLPPHVEEDTLNSAGLVGLLNALRQYDPAIGTAFEPYARLRIRGAILDEIRRLDWTPRSVHAKARQMQTAMMELEAQHGRLPTDEEMAVALGLSPADYERWLDEIRPATFHSLDVAILAGDGEELTVQELLPDESQHEPSLQVSNRELARLVSERIEQLPDLQRKILAFHYFEDMRLKEIAQALDFSEAHICQSHAKAILAIRAFIEGSERGRRQTKDRQP